MPAHSFKLIDYVRFAQLTAEQKAAARKLYQKHYTKLHDLTEQVGLTKRTHLLAPIIDCWFLPEGDGVSAHAFFERDPLLKSDH